MRVCCAFLIESPHRGDSNEYTQYTIFSINTKNHPKISQVCNYEKFSKGLKNEFESAVVNESSLFEPLKFYCIWDHFRAGKILSYSQINMISMSCCCKCVAALHSQ